MNESKFRQIVREELAVLKTGQLPELLTTQEAADLFQKSAQTLHNWRSKGIGPKYRSINGSIRYEKAALAEYIQNS